MTFTNLLLILGSACIHVVAHVALKRARNRDASIWWMLLWAGILWSPLLLWDRQAVSLQALGVMAVSAVFEALYFFSMAQAYKTGDLSVIYPLARGTAPLFLLIWAALFLNEPPEVGGVVGVTLIAFGLYAINLPSLGAWSAPLRAFTQQPGPRWALFAGLCISMYTFIDRIGIQLLEPLLYTYLVLWMTVGLLTPITFRAVGWPGLQAERRSGGWATMIAGFTTTAAYVIVLYVMQAGTRASYAGAVREISVVLGAAVGLFWLREPGTTMRLVGAGLVAAGVVVIKFFG